MSDVKYYYISKGIGIFGIWMGAGIGALAGVGEIAFYGAMVSTIVWGIFG